MAGLYIHIPFCKQACYYCDFHFSTSQELTSDLVNSLCAEMGMQKNYLEGERIETIYLGGGTPSLLAEHHLQNLFNAIDKNFTLAKPEVTLEANPDDLSKETLMMLKKIGVNRLSVGIQSFDDEILKFLNRAHTAADAELALRWAQDAGFDNISVDLIYSIPGQNNAAWKKNISRAIGFSPQHISAYSLTIEDRTVFGHQQKKGKFLAEPEELAATQMEILIKELFDAGYDHYETSNFSKPGFYSRHNCSYWQQKKYLGIGPSAHSYNGISRQHNIRNNPLYIQSIKEGALPCQLEVLTRANKVNEYLLTTLRTSWGCDLNYLAKELDYDLLKESALTMTTLLMHGLVHTANNILTLTQKGKLLADKIASDLFVKE